MRCREHAHVLGALDPPRRTGKENLCLERHVLAKCVIESVGTRKEDLDGQLHARSPQVDREPRAVTQTHIDA